MPTMIRSTDYWARIALGIVFLFSFKILAAQCTGGSNMGAITPTSSFQTIACVNAGQYYTFNATAGATYTFSFCQGGGSAPFSFDTYLTILDNSGTPVAGAFNDNACFPIFSEVVWVAPVGGTFRILISLPAPGCGTNAICATMAYRCIAPIGPGATCALPRVIPALPYSNSGLTTCGAINNFNSTMACGSTYMNGEDYVFTYNSPGNECIDIRLTGTTSWTGVFLLDNCPSTVGANCIALNESGAGNPSIIGANLNNPGTYYIVVSTLPPPNCTPFNISVTPCPTGATCSKPRVVPSLPYINTSMTTCGFGDEYDSGDACSSTFMNGDDFVFSYTTSGPECIDIFLTNTDDWTGVFVLDGCPDAIGTNCIGTNTSIFGNPLLQGTFLPNAGTYYIVVSTSPMPQCTPFDIRIDTCRPPVPCGLNPPPGDSCGIATDISAYSQFCGRTDTLEYRADSPGNLGSTFCGAIENNSWFSFVADSTEISFFFAVSNCYFGNGIQAQVLSSPDCQNFNAVSNCFNPGTQASGAVVASNLTIGNTYYLLIDGYARDDCEYLVYWDGGPLPVEWGNIQAARGTNAVEIQWETRQEHNCLGFFVERGKPADKGEPNGFDWQNLGFVDGQSNSEGLNSYVFQDHNPPVENAYYRIRQTDYNGFSMWTEVLFVAPNSDEINQLNIVYPNPSKDRLNFNFQLSKSETLQLIMMDISGKVVDSQEWGTFGAGNYTESISVSELPSGVYFYQLQIGKDKFRGKAVIAH